MNQQNFAPVVLFVYARADHTQRTLNALAANPEARDTDLIIYADAARYDKDVPAVQAVRDVINHVTGFKSVTLYLREKNVGLAQNIIEGVTRVSKEYGRVIVLEDDIVTSPTFLKFMNEALDLYRYNNDVMSISGCNYPVNLEDIKDDTYFLRIPLCWGWATWEDRWSLFEKKLNYVPLVSRKLIKQVNFNGAHDFFQQARMNYEGKLNTWFIFWYIAAVTNKKLTLFPSQSLVSNIGFDGTGENCGECDYLYQEASNKKIEVIKQEVIESESAFNAHVRYFKSIKGSFFNRLKSKINRLIKNGHLK